MDKRIAEFFKNEKIEYYSALAYDDVFEVNSRLRERSNIDAKSVIIFLLPY